MVSMEGSVSCKSNNFVNIISTLLLAVFVDERQMPLPSGVYRLRIHFVKKTHLADSLFPWHCAEHFQGPFI